jgi:ribosome biogenesis protein ERB1
MASLAVNRKRKQTIKEQSDASDAEQFPDDGGLDLLSEDEEKDGTAQGSDSDEIDAFPEIDAGSDPEEEEEEEEASPGEDEEDSESEDEEQDDDDASSDNDLHIFPRSKTIISDITGQPKKVYPEIEPDYDSDSSTEDVRVFQVSVCSDQQIKFSANEGAKPRRKHTTSLV